MKNQPSTSGVSELTGKIQKSVNHPSLRCQVSSALMVAVALLLLSVSALTAQVANSPFDAVYNGVNIGKVTFDTYKDDSNASVYAALIQGGFDPNANGAPAAGFGYRWLQTVNTTFPIPTYTWQTAGTTYMDRTRVTAAPRKLVADQSPFYVNERGPGYGYKLGFQDRPSRRNTNAAVTAAFSGTWTLYLVSANLTVPDGKDPNIGNANQGIDGKREIDVITSFTWGFTVKDGVVAVTAPITQQTGAAYDATFASLKTAFNTTDPDQNTFGNSWNLVQIVPEPSTLALLAFLGLPLLFVVARKPKACFQNAFGVRPSSGAATGTVNYGGK